MELPVIFPMGALSDDKKLEEAINSRRWICERKFDGSRYLIRKELNGDIHVVSRQKSKSTGLPVEKTENVPHLVDMMRSVTPGTILDGEIITDITCTSNEVTKIMGAKPEKAIQRQKEYGYVKYVVYDLLYFNGESYLEEKWVDRRRKLERVIENYIGLENKYIILSAYLECGSDKVENWFNEIVSNDGEGLVLKNKNSYYIPGKKVAGTWLKYKKHDTYDVVITGYKDAEMVYTGKETENPFGYWQFWMDKNTGEKYNMPSYRMCDASDSWIPVTRFYFYDLIGAIKFGQYKNGELVELGETSGMTDEVRRYFSENKNEMLGTVIEIGCMMRMEDTGSFRHPHYIQMRPDKSANECIWGQY